MQARTVPPDSSISCVVAVAVNSCMHGPELACKVFQPYKKLSTARRMQVLDLIVSAWSTKLRHHTTEPRCLMRLLLRLALPGTHGAARLALKLLAPALPPLRAAIASSGATICAPSSSEAATVAATGTAIFLTTVCSSPLFDEAQVRTARRRGARVGFAAEIAERCIWSAIVTDLTQTCEYRITKSAELVTCASYVCLPRKPCF
jgi:hypothetical protein